MSDIYKDFWEEANKYDAEHPIQVIKVRVDENPNFNLEILKQVHQHSVIQITLKLLRLRAHYYQQQISLY